MQRALARIEDRKRQLNTATPDADIYRAPGRTIDVSADTQQLPTGWRIEQDGDLWIGYDQNGKRIPAP